MTGAAALGVGLVLPAAARAQQPDLPLSLIHI